MFHRTIMNAFAKVVISVDDGMLSMELVFNILQRKVFANTTLDVCVFTSEVNKVSVLAENIEKCCFSNMNDFVVTDDHCKAFRNADYLLFMFNSNAESTDNLQQLKPVVEKAKLFDRWANPNARVLIIGPQSNTLLQIFAEVATNLSKYNFTGLSRHYVSKATILIAQKLKCRAIDLSHVYVWGDGLLDLNTVKERMGFDGGNAYLPCMPREPENVIDRLPLDWSEKVLTPLMVETARTNGHCLVHAACQHMVDWCHGTAGRGDDGIVCMTTVVRNRGRMNDGVYSSYPVAVDENGVISVMRTVETDSLLKVKLHKFYENQQKERYRIRNFISNINKSIAAAV